jgi:hypothetical protein
MISVSDMAIAERWTQMKLAVSRCLYVGLMSVFAGCGGDKFDQLESYSVNTTSVIVEAARRSMDDGSTGVRVRRVDELSDIVVYEGSVANDGEDLTIENVRPDFRSVSDLRLCLNGTGQEDVYVRMDVLARSVSSTEQTCTR